MMQMAYGVDPTFTTAASAIILALSAAGFLMMMLFWHRRHMSPIKQASMLSSRTKLSESFDGAVHSQRKPWLVLATNIVCLANPLINVAVWQGGFESCLTEVRDVRWHRQANLRVQAWLRWTFAPFLGTVLVYRVIELIFASSIAADRFEKLAPQSSQMETRASERGRTGNWFARHSRLANSWLLVAVAVSASCCDPPTPLLLQVVHAAVWYLAFFVLANFDHTLQAASEPDCVAVQTNVNNLTLLLVLVLIIEYGSLTIVFLRGTVAE